MINNKSGPLFVMLAVLILVVFLPTSATRDVAKQQQITIDSLGAELNKADIQIERYESALLLLREQSPESATQFLNALNNKTE